MKILRHDAVKTQRNLLMAASEIFAERGFRDATIMEISKRAKTNVAAINYHFGDKRNALSGSMAAFISGVNQKLSA